MPRAIALDLLTAVLDRRRPLDEVLGEHPGLAALTPRDRAFARLLVATTLRRLGQIDALIDGCLVRPLPERARAARHILRLGVCQLVFLGTAPHAAVATAVDLAQARGQGPLKKLVNAVLRRLAREGAARAAAQDAARLNTPAWLWESWTAAYGPGTCRRIAEAHLAEAPLDITLKDRAVAEAWAARLGAAVLPTGSLRRPAAAVPELPGFAEGAWWVQDAAAALPARLLGEVRKRTVLDLCAAPGGKTAQLAAAGARVTAVERSEARMARLRGNLARLGLVAETVIGDAAAWRPAEPADAVLLDVPCSATGTIRRHPDVAHLKGPDDVAGLAATQDRLLRAALEMVQPGGVLVFCSCSLQPEEGPARIAALMADGAPVERVPVTADEVGGLAEVLNADGDLRTLPCHLGAQGGMDGFYACRLRRR